MITGTLTFPSIASPFPEQAFTKPSQKYSMDVFRKLETSTPPLVTAIREKYRCMTAKIGLEYGHDLKRPIIGPPASPLLFPSSTSLSPALDSPRLFYHPSANPYSLRGETERGTNGFAFIMHR